MTAEQIAELMHETYERLAPAFDYRTRAESAVPWEDVPANNRKLMVAVAERVLEAIRGRLDFLPIHPQWLGWYNEEYGTVVGVRSLGEELLFATKDTKRTVRWIPVTDFMMEPLYIWGVQDIKRGRGE